jgi:hypothetical protein
MSPFRAARSPFTATGRCRVAMGVPLPSQVQNFWGWMKALMPVSSRGLMLMIRAPRSAAAWRVVSMRGWLVPGFWPMRRMQSAWLKSSRVTEPLPLPSTSRRARPLDSWHMFEQSGRLLVPNIRTKSW